MIDVSKTTEKIIDVFKEKGVKLNKKDVMTNLSSLVNDFNMPLVNAERTIMERYAKEHDVIVYAPRSSELRDIASLTKDKEWVSLEAKVISVFEPEDKRIFQKAIIGDATGTMYATLWARKAGETMLKKVEAGKCYRFSNVITNEYNGKISISIQKNADIGEIKKTIDVKSNEIELVGCLVKVRAGSGLIKRCDVEDCKRTLSRQNFCPVHEVREKFDYDMRIKGVLDDGKKVYEIVMKAEPTENISGIRQKDAIKIAENNPLGMDEVFNRVQKVILGRYYTIKGSLIGDRVVISECEPISFEEFRKITGIKLDNIQSTLEG